MHKVRGPYNLHVGDGIDLHRSVARNNMWATRGTTLLLCLTNVYLGLAGTVMLVIIIAAVVILAAVAGIYIFR